jgi:hypothetical protein
MWLIVVDAMSKWPEAIPMSSTSAEATARALSRVFATHGFPKAIVSDNGPQFTSEEFEGFCKERGIRHILTPPYHPQSNGEAERFVQTFKNHLEKGLTSGRTLDMLVAEILMQYRVTEHPATGVAPAQLMLGRKPRTKLDLIRPEVGKTMIEHREAYTKRMIRNHDKKCREKTFKELDVVMVKNYREGHKWVKGVVIKVCGARWYRVKTDCGTWKRHANQIKHFEGEIVPTRMEVPSEDVANPQEVVPEGKSEVGRPILRDRQRLRAPQRYTPEIEARRSVRFIN